jgi:protein phosphatase
VKIIIAAKTDVGLVRGANEDSYMADGPLFAVADGMGGHVAGDVASQTAIKAIVDTAASHPPSTPEDLELYVKRANQDIWEKATADSRLRGMGTTCTLLYIDGSTAYLAHVGDSRAYLFRGGELSQLSEDHTLVQRMVKEGRLRQDEAAHHPQRNIITRTLGVDPEVDVDLLTFELIEGDRLLINSDGLSSMIGDEAIKRTMAAAETADDAAAGLIEAALEAGGEDNITVIVLDVESDDGEKSSAPARVETQPREVSIGASSDEVELDEPLENAKAPQRSRLARTLLVTLLVLAILGAGAYGATRYALANSWYIGANDAGAITIYRGIPDEIAGLNLKEEYEASSLEVSDLPPSYRESVVEGIKKDSLEEAQTTIDNFRELIKNFRDAGSGDGGGSGTKNGSNQQDDGNK